MNKIIRSLLFIVIAISCYFMFISPTREPIELSEDVKRGLLNESDEITVEQSFPQSADDAEQQIDMEGLVSTPLDISLIGLVASDVDTEASATIQSRLQIRTYLVNDQIAYTNAVIMEIRNDRVILLNEGERQVLLFRGTPSSNLNSSKQSKPKRGYDQQSSDNEIAQAIGNRPKLLEHIVSISPFDQSNISAGFAVSPGMNPKLFNSTKFKQGDVLQQINGNDITTDEGMQAVQELIPNAQTLVFSVLRGGSVINLYLDIPSENLSIQKD